MQVLLLNRGSSTLSSWLTSMRNYLQCKCAVTCHCDVMAIQHVGNCKILHMHEHESGVANSMLDPVGKTDWQSRTDECSGQC